jgi:hypothetical protein
LANVAESLGQLLHAVARRRDELIRVGVVRQLDAPQLAVDLRRDVAGAVARRHDDEQRLFAARRARLDRVDQLAAQELGVLARVAEQVGDRSEVARRVDDRDAYRLARGAGPLDHAAQLRHLAP